MRLAIMLGVALGVHTVSAQSLEQRIAGARGTVAFEYTTRPNVCGNGYSLSITDDGRTGFVMNSSRSGIHIGRSFAGDNSVCEPAPARVVISRVDGDITELAVTVGGKTQRADTELGAIPAPNAAAYLLGIAPRLAGRAADQAVMGAAIADSATPWKRMLAIARENSASESARKASLFWVSQEATAVATAGLRDVAMDDDANAKVRSDALFYLAQRRDQDGIPSLIRVVQESKSVKLRKDAIFYLSQSRDPRALDLFEKLLSGR